MTIVARTVDELREVPSTVIGKVPLAFVNGEEAFTLCRAGAKVVGSGALRRGGARCQFYFIPGEGRLYFWVAGSLSGSWGDLWPVTPANIARLEATLGSSRAIHVD